MYSCIIVDDEVHAIDTLKKYLGAMPEFNVLESFNDPLVALKMILQDTRPIDLIFMDVDMPMISGIELAGKIRSKTHKLIFTTSHSQYAYEAFQLHADGYLLKPYSLSDFVALVSKLFPEKSANDSNDNFFFVKNKTEENQIVKVNFDEVIAVESKLNYVVIHTLKKNVTSYIPLSEISKSFIDRPGFMQFQRSFIINKEYIESIDGRVIKMAKNVQLTVGDFYRKEFKEFLAKNLIKRTY